jgi:two-component system, OmpR family, sensor histidine kinase VicK
MTKSLEGDQSVVTTILQFVSNTKDRIDACIGYSRPSLAIEIEELKRHFLTPRVGVSN